LLFETQSSPRVLVADYCAFVVPSESFNLAWLTSVHGLYSLQYSINKSKILLGFVGQQWEQHIVAELDSALNKWIDSIPDHRMPQLTFFHLTLLTDTIISVRWDPNREDHLFFSQSVSLYASYYHLQILIHRPFIPSPRNPSPLSFPSLAICTNAARSCSHVVEIHRKRGLRALSHVQVRLVESFKVAQMSRVPLL
jgi:hypothetical protein